MRRAGFGASRSELDALVAKGYEAVVDDLVNPERLPDVDEDILERYYGGEGYPIFAGIWFFRMLNSQRPLQEKMALFWHHVFATGVTKNQHVMSAVNQIKMFRSVGMHRPAHDITGACQRSGDDLLAGQQRDPQRRAERELGAGASGTVLNGRGQLHGAGYQGRIAGVHGLDFRAADTAVSSRVLSLRRSSSLRKTTTTERRPSWAGAGNLNGEDIIDIIVEQPATARFIARHMYNFFVADEPQVPSWNTVPPQDQDAIDTLVAAYLQSDGDIRAMLSAMFNSDFFKAARFRKVKSPVELITGVIKLVGTIPRADAGDSGLFGGRLN